MGYLRNDYKPNRPNGDLSPLSLFTLDNHGNAYVHSLERIKMVALLSNPRAVTLRPVNQVFHVLLKTIYIYFLVIPMPPFSSLPEGLNGKYVLILSQNFRNVNYDFLDG